MSFNLWCNARNNTLKLSVFENVNEVNATQWDRVNADGNIYLTIDYLKALESALNDGTAFRYLVFEHEEFGAVAIAAIQIVNFKGSSVEYTDQLCFFARMIKEQFINPKGFKVMTCGNVFACGENGIAYTDDLPAEEIFANLNDALSQLQKKEKTTLDSSLILLKEFWPENVGTSKLFKEFKFRDFSADVNMVLKLSPSWKTMDDYLASMQAKFRTKANAAFKRSASIEGHSLSADEIRKHSKEIEKLYLAVVNKSPYTFGKLNAEAFANFKESLGDDFTLNGYFLDGKLVSFSSAFAFHGILDANYVGIDYKLNIEYALYPRMLYDFVEQAIKIGASELRLGRTAEEMKSSIGAEPVDMRLYVRHENSLSNKLIKPIINAITPSAFELRKPFKVQYA